MLESIQDKAQVERIIIKTDQGWSKAPNGEDDAWQAFGQALASYTSLQGLDLGPPIHAGSHSCTKGGSVRQGGKRRPRA